MDESPNKRAVIVGIFVFAGLIFLLGGILLVGSLRDTFVRKIELVSCFDDVNGLKKGNNVWYSGLKVGTVNDLNFYGKSQVEVTFSVTTKTSKYIRKDARVKISSDGLIGNKILVIYGGTDQSPTVKQGDTLEVEKTFSSDDVINTLQNNNKNILAITNDLKVITNKLATGQGTIGKLLNDSSAYTNMNAAIISLQTASAKAQNLIGTLNEFSLGLNKKGTLVSELTNDTVVFKSIKASVTQLQQMADTATAFISNLKQAEKNPNTALGVLIHDEESGARLKGTIKNIESSSVKLNDDLEAVQHNFLLRGFFRKKAKEQGKNSPEK